MQWQIPARFEKRNNGVKDLSACSPNCCFVYSKKKRSSKDGIDSKDYIEMSDDVQSLFFDEPPSPCLHFRGKSSGFKR